MKLMHLLKKTDLRFKLIILLFTLSFLGGQTIIANQNPVREPLELEPFGNSILTPERFHMHQGFSLITSTSDGISQTKGIYSNFSSYALSERLQINSKVHLIKKQPSYAKDSQTGLGYELGLEYKLSPNSIIIIQFANYHNSPMFYRNYSLFNVP